MPHHISHIKGNIFTSSCQTFVNAINCMGVMGAGIALEFKYRYPDMFSAYAKLCKARQIHIGELWVYNIPAPSRKILSFPTRLHWKDPSQYEYLEKGLERFINTYEEKASPRLHFPCLVCRMAGLILKK